MGNPTASSAPISDDKVLRGFLRDLEAAMRPHEKRVEKYKKHDATYHAEVKRTESMWQSALFPPYAFQIIETILANIIDQSPSIRVRAAAPMYQAGAEKHEALMQAQRRKDHYAEKQPTWALQALVRGISPAKVVWEYETRQQTQWGMASPDSQERVPIQKTKVIANHPSFVPWDAMDFCWDPAATSQDDWCHVFARTWDTLDSLKRLEEFGTYKNTDQIENAPRANEQVATDQIPGRDTKGRIEVWERWTPDRVTTVANRKVVLRDDPNPFWHGQIPFIIAVPIPVPFRVEGKGFAELVRDLQKALWDLQNQMVDNGRRLNNFVRYFDKNRVDQDEMADLFPGKLVGVDGPPGDLIEAEVMPASILEAATVVTETMRKDLQDVTGAVAYVSGAAQETVDQTTATGISIVQNMALKRLQRVREQFGYAEMREGYMHLKLNQQMIEQPTPIRIGDEFAIVDPEELQGEYEFDIEDIEESLNEQQRRQEALVKAQTIGALAPLDPSAVNVRALIGDISEAFGEDPEKYINPVPPPAPVLPPGPVAQAPMVAQPPAPTPPVVANGAGAGGPVPFAPHPAYAARVAAGG